MLGGVVEALGTQSFFSREIALVSVLEREALWRLVVDKKHGTIGVVF